jgi:hypothetical protein
MFAETPVLGEEMGAMTDEIRGSARLVLGRLRNRVEGRFAVAVLKTAEGHTKYYNVFYSDSQATEVHVTRDFLERLKQQGYHVLVTETPSDKEHEI